MQIPEIESDRLVVDSSRRLTGPSLVWSEPGAILDVLVSDVDMEAVLDCWYRNINAVLDEAGWNEPRLTHRQFEDGYNLLLAAPIDQLYSAVLAQETAWYFCTCELLGLPLQSRAGLIEALREQMREEKDPALIEIESAAADHNVDFLVDDDTISLGQGCGSHSYSRQQLPAPGEVAWSDIHDVPVALITGTNGKSTSVRLLDTIARAAGRVSGVTSTDFVRVGDDVLDRGDYSGPGGARLLLRDRRLEVAFLEVARGGILRRGLPLKRAGAALVTNIASDHLGQYGVNNLAALTATKFAVRKSLADDGMLVANADDEQACRYLDANKARNLCWFSLHRSNPLIEAQIGLQRPCCYVENEHLQYFDGQASSDICAIGDIPMTLNGAALHNVQNALGAIGIAMAMGFSVQDIRTGLGQFNSDAGDNPGRMNHFQLANGARVIVDFAHNEAGVNAIVETVGRMPAARKWALFGSAGDRSDAHMTAIASSICSFKPDEVVITELDDYLRGRKPGEVSGIMQQACLQAGIAADRLRIAESPLEGVRVAVQGMQPGDLGLFLVLSDRDEIIRYLESH